MPVYVINTLIFLVLASHTCGSVACLWISSIALLHATGPQRRSEKVRWLKWKHGDMHRHSTKGFQFYNRAMVTSRAGPSTRQIRQLSREHHHLGMQALPSGEGRGCMKLFLPRVKYSLALALVTGAGYLISEYKVPFRPQRALSLFVFADLQ